MTAELVIDVHDLHKSYRTRKVVDGITLAVAAGEICGFLGTNGNGKTTTIRMLCGLVKPDAGGHAWGSISFATRRRSVFRLAI
jgi:ABC-type multidrug transport system ATPase subunit